MDILDSLRRAIEADPDDVHLRLHLAALLLDANEPTEAIAHIAAALALDPESAKARELMSRALAPATSFDWYAAEKEVLDLAPPMFVESQGAGAPSEQFLAERPTITLRDVGGMVD